MRHLLGALGGVLLAFLLFALLALLVIPPQDDRQVTEISLALTTVAETQEQPSEAPAPAESAPSPPTSTPPPPPPQPMPSPAVESDIRVPEPELPPLERPDIPQALPLPELAEIEPQPEPEPEPEPQPQPEPSPAPQQPSQPELASPSSSPSTAEPSNQPSETASASAEAGSPQPTVRVAPEYPSRAQRRGLEGYVEVRFTIRPDGSVDSDSLRVVEARPRNVFERAALRAITRWQFAEAAHPREARQRLEFRLEG